MKKGDLRKQQLIQTGEQLFCKNGYESTSVQEILDLLNTSKGSFYHHFPSKEALLEAICRDRAVKMASQSEQALQTESDSLHRLQMLYAGLIPLQGNHLHFLLMLLPVFDLPEGRSVREAYCLSLRDAFLDPITTELERGMKEEVLYCTDCRMAAELTLSLLNDCWSRLCEQIISCIKQALPVAWRDLLRQTDQYRLAIEKIIGAPYGSLTLIDLPDIIRLSDQIRFHWKIT